MTRSPSPPASRDSASSRVISATSSAVATSAPRSSPITQRRRAQWPTRKPALTPEVSLEPAEVLAEAGPVPGQTVLQGGEGHALDLGHHPTDVVVVLGLDGGQGEAAVPADHRGHPVEIGRGGGGVPEQLGVVVGVGVDDAGGHHQALGIEFGGALLVDLDPRPRSCRPGCRRRPGARAPRCRRRPGRCGSRSRA